MSFGSMNRYRPPIGYPGMPSDIGVKYDRSYSNVANDVSQVSTITVTTYAAGATYMVTVNGQTFSYTAPATGGSLATVAAALLEQANLYGLGVVAKSASSTSFTLTSQPGEPFTLSVAATGGGALTGALTTPPVTTGEVELGLAVVRVATDGDREARLGDPSGTHLFLGVTIDPGYLNRGCEPTSNPWQNAKYRRGDMMLVREEGSCFVQIEEDVDPSMPVFYRYTGSGTTGAFRGSASSGAQQLVSARWLTRGKAGQFAELRLGVAPTMIVD